jgi:hypothetical protein
MVASRSHPFQYPKFRHTRGADPGPYSRYQSYKPHLRREFRQKCIYCRRPDSVHPNDVDVYAVEHYRPKKKFPEFELVWTNLFYVCADCNSHKRDYWPRDNEPCFPNPCDDVMADHVWYSDGVLEAHTPEGKLMCDSLWLNVDDLVEYRRWHVRTIVATAKELKELRRLIKKTRKRTRANPTSSGDQADLQALEASADILEKELRRFQGTTHH